MRNFFLTLLSFILLISVCSAQNGKNKFKFGDIMPEDFVVKDFPESEQAHAVYLLDEVSSFF